MDNTFDIDRLIATGLSMQSDRQAQEQRRQVPQHDVTLMPVIQQRSAKVASFLAGEIRRPAVTRFGNMREVSHKITSVNRWPDLHPGQRKVYNLYFIESKIEEKKLEVQIELAKLGLETIKNINTRPSPRDVGNLMLLAYNLVDRSGQHIFGKVPDDLVDMNEQEEFDSLSDKPIKNVTPSSVLSADYGLTTPDKVEKIKVAVCYLACSYMRLYTKSASSYSKIGYHIQRRFKNFYGYPFPLSNFHPDDESIMTVKTQLELNTVLRATFYNFLYAGEICPQGVNLKKFLYEIHVAFTGLHPYTLFYRAMEVLRISNRDLAYGLYSKNIEPELKVLSDVFAHVADAAQDAYKYQMWRFARIFDQNFLSILQTKNCTQFTMILAYLLSIADPTRHKDVLKIAQIEDASKELKTIAKRFAERAHIIFTNSGRGVQIA